MKSIRDRLGQAISQTDKSGKGLTGQIRGVIDEIESAIRDDYKLRAIVETLNANGICITYGYLKTVLCRIRKERKKAKIREPTTHARPRPTAVVIPATQASKPTGYAKTIRSEDEMF